VIKLVALSGALSAGLFASPLDTFSIEVRMFIGLVGAAMGGLGSLGFLLLHHLVCSRHGSGYIFLQWPSCQ
jgi:hypothetical protein